MNIGDNVLSNFDEVLVSDYINHDKELKDNYIDYVDISKIEKSINNYFESKNGACE